MGEIRMRKLFLLATALVVGTASAQAADLPPPPAQPSPWSFSVFGGASWLQDVETGTTIDIGDESYDFDVDYSFDTGFLVGGTIGYAFVDFARTELEVAYANYGGGEAVLSYADQSWSVDPGDNLEILTVMGNMWLGLNMLPVIGDPLTQAGGALGFSPYAGGGLGIGFVNVDDVNSGLAWQVGAGVRWNFASNFGLDVGYRFRGVTDIGLGELDAGDFYSNNVIVGLVFNF